MGGDTPQPRKVTIMKTIQRNESDSPWTDDEAQSYANAHNLTVIAINGHTLVVA